MRMPGFGPARAAARERCLSRHLFSHRSRIRVLTQEEPARIGAMSPNAFGRWLKQRRKEFDLTQDGLASRIGCATSTVQKIEAGRRRPSPEFAGRIAEVLEVAPEKRQAFIEFARGSEEFTAAELFRPPTNLPAPLTPLIDRRREMAEVSQRLLQENTRLVTLVGPPGIGKTRLSLEVAARVRDHFPDGVFFVPLAAVTDPDLIAPAIAKSIGLKESGRTAPAAHLCNSLRLKRLLLLLDNFEQIVCAAPLLAELLAGCPLLKLMVTSRIPLHLRPERQYPVAPLALPDPDRLPPVEELSCYGAIALFADRAEAVRPGFTITADNAAAVAALCHRLDGLPLAIEVISARVRVLEPAELLARLGSSLLLQTHGPHDADRRQHTLEEAIAWSYELLSPEEQELFGRLGVFVGGWSLEAAEFLQKQREAPERPAAVELLHALVDKSLVQGQAGPGRSRFTMLQMIREYALQRLEDSPEANAVRWSHARYYLALAQAAGPRLHQSVEEVKHIEREHDNLRAALRWSLEQGDVEMAYRLVVALASLWTIHTWHLGEGRGWFRRLLSAGADALAPAARARLLQQAGILAYLQSDYAAAGEYLEQALALARETGDEALIAHSLHGLSNVAMNEERYREVAALLEECLPLARRAGEVWVEAMALNNLAEVARLEGDLDGAARMFEEGLDLLTGLGDRYFTPILLDGLGTLAQYRGDYERARTLHSQCLTLCREMDDRRIIALSLEKLAGVAVGQGQAGRAARLLGAAEALREAINVPVESVDRVDYARIVAATSACLERGVFARAWARGRAMELEQAIALAGS